MIKGLVIGHTYILSANRGKLRELAARSDVKIGLICPDRWLEPDFGMRKVEFEDNFEIIPVHAFWIHNVRRYAYSPVELYNAIARFKPDIVQLESEAVSLAAAQLALFKKLLHFRSVLFVWDNLVHDSWRWRKFGHISYRATDYLIAGSKDALRVARRHGYRKAASVLAQTGVDVSRFDKVKAIDPWEGREGFRVGFVGRLDPRKGLPYLIDAIKDLPQALLTIVGDGSEKAAYEKGVEEANVADRCKFIGAITHKQVPSFLLGMDALVLPSISTPGWVEQFGHVLIEGMAAGIPLIGSRSGVIPEVIGEAGLLVDEKDSGQLAQAISTLIEDPKLAEEIAARGKLAAKTRFSDQAVADRTFEIWQEVLQAK